MAAIADCRDETMLAAVPGRTIARQVVWLAVPVLVEQALLYLVGLSDTVLTARFLSVDHLAAVTNAVYLMWFLGSLMIVVSVGATALVARLIGAGDRAGACRICGQAIGLAWIVGLATAAAGLAAAPALVGALNLTGRAATEAVAYLRIVLVITPLLASETVGVACLRGAGDTRTGMRVMILVNAINVAVSWALAIGLGPLPRLELRGIAIGTACGEGVGGLILLALLARGRSGLRLSRAGLVPDGREVRRILRISAPAMGESLTTMVCQLWFLGLINRLGTVASAAHGIAIRCESIAFLLVTAFSVAAATLTGQYLGARRPDLAARAARTAWAMGVAVLCGLGLLLYTQAAPMVALFLGEGRSGVAVQGAAVVRVVAFATPAMATLIVLSGALRGAGDTRWPWAIVLVGFLTVRLPLAYHLTYPPSAGGLGWGLYGAWVAMLADLCIRGALIAIRFLQGGWRLVRV